MQGRHSSGIHRSRNRICVLFCAALLVAIGTPLMAGKNLVYPLVGERISSNFGNRKHPVLRYMKHHEGIDLAAPKGAAIRAVADGVVVYADPYEKYGNLIVIQHQRGMSTHYGHCDTMAVRPGQRVEAGRVIGTVGATGRVTGPHLHFEVRQSGEALDPLQLLPGLTEAAAG